MELVFIFVRGWQKPNWYVVFSLLGLAWEVDAPRLIIIIKGRGDQEVRGMAP